MRESSFGGSTITTRVITTVKTDVEWNGSFYTQRVQEFSQPDSSAIGGRNTFYLSVDFDNQILEEAGRVLVSFDNETGDVISAGTEIFTPPIRTRFALHAGDTFSQTYQVASLSGTEPTIGPINEVKEETKIDRFLGIGPINVNMNNVDTCRIETEIVTETGTVGEETEIGTFWLDKDNGLFVQAGFGSDPVDPLFQLKSAEINSASVF